MEHPLWLDLIVADKLKETMVVPKSKPEQETLQAATIIALQVLSYLPCSLASFPSVIILDNCPVIFNVKMQNTSRISIIYWDDQLTIHGKRYLWAQIESQKFRQWIERAENT